MQVQWHVDRHANAFNVQSGWLSASAVCPVTLSSVQVSEKKVKGVTGMDEAVERAAISSLTALSQADVG